MESLEQRPVFLPSEVWAAIDSLAVGKSAEFVRHLLITEVGRRQSDALQLQEKALSIDAKKYAIQKMKQRQGSMAEALEVIKRKWQLDVAVDETELLSAIAAIEKGLND